MPGHWKKDIDYIKPGYPFTIRWSNVFIDAADIIDRFNILERKRLKLIAC
jgi:hypothetical protein